MRGLLLPTALALLLALPLLWRAATEVTLPVPGADGADASHWHRVSAAFEPAAPAPGAAPSPEAGADPALEPVAFPDVTGR